MRRRNGVTLFEALVALTIVGATALAALANARAGTDAGLRAIRVQEASALATEMIAVAEVALAAPGAELPDSLAAGRFEPPFAMYAWETRVTPDPDLPGLLRLDVTIRWGDAPSAEVVFALPTEFYRPPLVVRGPGRGAAVVVP